MLITAVIRANGRLRAVTRLWKCQLTLLGARDTRLLMIMIIPLWECGSFWKRKTQHTDYWDTEQHVQQLYLLKDLKSNICNSKLIRWSLEYKKTNKTRNYHILILAAIRFCIFINFFFYNCYHIFYHNNGNKISKKAKKLNKILK